MLEDVTIAQTKSFDAQIIFVSNSIFFQTGIYDWTNTEQGLILSSFFWGYVITHLPGGLLAERFGGKYTLGFGILGTAVFTLLTPVVVEEFGATGLIVIRVIEGLGEVNRITIIIILLLLNIHLNNDFYIHYLCISCIKIVFCRVLS